MGGRAMFKKQMVLDDVILFRTGKPFNTTAVIKEITDDFDNSEDFPYFEVKEYENYYEFVYEMDKDDYVYGLGEQLGALNKRGKEYKLYSTDDPIHTPEKGSLYGSHPFAFIDGSKKFAFMIDFPGEIVFDI
jgi:alpha-glucosidase